MHATTYITNIKTLISIVIPIFNEEKNIPALVERLRKSVCSLGIEYEFIFVNDGSRDHSLKLIKQFSLENNSIKYIDLSRNFGHQISICAGIELAKGNQIVLIDGDLQDPPELIPTLYHKMQEGYEVVYARRKHRKGEGFFKLWTAKVFYRILAKITSIDIPLDTGDFRIIDKKVADILRKMPEQQKFLRGQIAWMGFRQTYMDYDRDERVAGSTGYSYLKMIRFALDGITSFSNLPLRFATITGFIVSAISFLMIIYSLCAKFFLPGYQPGWASLMLAVLFIGGIQLIGIGIIGEYISRMSSNIRKRPLYVVNETNISNEN